MAQVDCRSALSHGTFGWAYAGFLFRSAAQANCCASCPRPAMRPCLNVQMTWASAWRCSLLFSPAWQRWRSSGESSQSNMNSVRSTRRAGQLHWRTSVEEQRAADATGIPRLSETAMMAIGVMGAAKDDRERVDAWRAAQANEQVAGELATFRRAVAQRFGDDGVRAMLRTAESRGAVAAASVLPDQGFR
jgi:hypothetical protein